MDRLKFFSALLALVLIVPAGLQAQAGRRGDVLDVNTAAEKQLLSVPGLTPAIVKTIMTRRPFLQMTDLDALLAPSIPAEKRPEVYRRLFVQINLNTASDAEIMLIPGLGKRMLGEFKEYRPYRALAQFRREIGKYVDDQERARLEQYVSVPITLCRASDAASVSIPVVGQRPSGEFPESRQSGGAQ